MSEETLPSGPDLDVAAAEEQAKQSTNGEPESQLPICPYCLHDPFQLREIPLNNEIGVQLITFSCADCRKIINVVIFRVPQPRVQPQRSPLIIPGIKM